MNIPMQVYVLCNSAEEDKSEELMVLLQDHPEVDVNLFRNSIGWTTLHAATFRGDLGCVRVLIGHGADVDARAQLGSTPIILASERGKLECLRC
jgi:ankyrin repeat protein